MISPGTGFLTTLYQAMLKCSTCKNGWRDYILVKCGHSTSLSPICGVNTPPTDFSSSVLQAVH